MKFRDHYNFNQKVWNKVEDSIKNLNINYILTTEKDWVKIQPLKRKTPVIVFELNITIDREEDFFKILKSIL
jgi:tetraacyldisaccharide-1-P 4'-kinase